MPTPLLCLSRDELSALIKTVKQPRFRADQLWGWLHQRRVDSWDAMSNLPRALREALAEGHALRVLAEEKRQDSADHLTHKWLYRTGDGEAVEAVLIRQDKGERETVCVSSMAGCPLGCVFCATGSGGFRRNLDAAEMIEQVYRVDAYRREETGDATPARAVDHVVFMGMGEPLLNLDAVLAAARRLCDPDGFGLSGRHVTLSTMGVLPGLERLIEERPPFRLAVSLHAPEQRLRDRLLPAAAQWPLASLMEALKRYDAVASRRLTFEYCLIDHVNDSPAQAKSLARLLKPFDCLVNLIPLNPVAGYDGAAPPANRIRAFQDVLEGAGQAVTLREEKGRDIRAACGQLRAESDA